MTEPAADLALEPLLLGQAITLAAAGAVVWVATLLLLEDPLVQVVAGALGLLAGLGAVWLVGRRVGVYDDLASGSGPERRSRTTAVRLGIGWGLLTLCAMLAVGVVETVVLDLEVSSMFGPLILIFACSLVYLRRQLLAWQDRHALTVCTRVGAARFAWTRRGARARLVVIPRPA